MEKTFLEKTFMIVSGDGAIDETIVSFVIALNKREVLFHFIKVVQDYDLSDQEDYMIVDSLLKEFPIGVVEFDPKNIKGNYEFDWFYDLRDIYGLEK